MDGETGFLVASARSRRRWRTALVRLLKDPALRSTDGSRRASSRARRKFSAERMVADTLCASTGVAKQEPARGITRGLDRRWEWGPSAN